jgi:hypothetical protein
MLITFILAYAVLCYTVRKKRLEDWYLVFYAPFIALFSFFTGKLLYYFISYDQVLSYRDEVEKWKDFFGLYNFTYDGYGILLGVILGAVIIYRRYIKLYEILDVVMLMYALVAAGGWFGLFFSNINYGTETSLPIGVVLQGLDLEVSNILVHPVQLYFALGYLILFIYFFIRYIQRVLSGSIFIKILIFSALMDISFTFLIQQCNVVWGMFCYNQYLSFATLIGALLFYVIKIRN